MALKTVDREVPWINKTAWQWPDGDTGLLEAFYDVRHIESIMHHVGGRRLCVQAGGAAGVWPLRYSQLFERVITFEPNRVLYEALYENTYRATNITRLHAALGPAFRFGSMATPAGRECNLGAWYVSMQPGDVIVLPLDMLGLADVGLIQLDVEGAETEALMGAAATIERCRPVIVIEQKPLPQAGPPNARQWLEGRHRYRVAANLARDVVMVPLP